MWGGKVIALFAGATHTNSGIYIVKSAMRLINSGNLPIKNPDAVWIYALRKEEPPRIRTGGTRVRI
jgi:hypothetical protein